MIKYEYKLVIRRDTAENWAVSEYIPLEGEPCYDLTNKVIRVGNGIDLFTGLESNDSVKLTELQDSINSILSMSSDDKNSFKEIVDYLDGIDLADRIEFTEFKDKTNTALETLFVKDRIELLALTGLVEGQVVTQVDINLLYEYTTTQGTDNGGTIINVDGGSFIAQYNSTIQAKWFISDNSLTSNNTQDLKNLFDSLVSGDTVLFGDFDNSLRFDCGVLRLDNKDDITLDFKGASLTSTRDFDGDSESSDIHFRLVNCNRILLKNATGLGRDTSLHLLSMPLTFIRVEGCTHIHMTKCNLSAGSYGNVFQLAGASHYCGITFCEAINTIEYGNDGQAGVFFNVQSTVELSNYCYCSDNKFSRGWALVLAPCTLGLRVERNYAEYTFDSTIYTRGEKSIIKYNEIYRSGKDCIKTLDNNYGFNYGSNLIEGNTVTECALINPDGILIGNESPDTKIINNIMNGVSDLSYANTKNHGIVSEGQNCLIANNNMNFIEIDGPVGVAISLNAGGVLNSSGTIVSNNNIKGFCIAYTWNTGVDCDLTNIIIDGGNISTNGAGIFYVIGTDNGANKSGLVIQNLNIFWSGDVARIGDIRWIDNLVIRNCHITIDPTSTVYYGLELKEIGVVTIMNCSSTGLIRKWITDDGTIGTLYMSSQVIDGKLETYNGENLPNKFSTDLPTLPSSRYQNGCQIFLTDIGKPAYNKDDIWVYEYDSNYNTQSSNYTTIKNDYIYADTSTASFTITLPALPEDNTILNILDSTGSFDINGLILNGNGKDIMGASDEVTLDYKNKEYKVIYTGTEWRII